MSVVMKENIEDFINDICNSLNGWQVAVSENYTVMCNNIYLMS